MPTTDVEYVSSWFHSVIVPMECVHEPILLVATGNCLTGFHVDDRPPTEVVASLLLVRKLWSFASHGSKSALLLVKRPEKTHIEQFLEEVIYCRYQEFIYCLQELSDTVLLPARAFYFVFSVTPNIQWTCLLGHKVLHEEAQVLAMDCKAFNRCSGPQSGTAQGKRTKRSGVTKKRFTPRKRVQSS